MRVLKSIAWAPVYALGGAFLSLAIVSILWVIVATVLMLAGTIVLGDPMPWAEWWAHEASGSIIIWALRIGTGVGFIIGPFIQYSEYKEDPNAPKTLEEFCAQSIKARKRKKK